MKKIILLVFIILAIGAGAFVWGENYYTGGNALSQPATVIIEKGDGLKIIARKLENAEIIEYPQAFLISAKITRQTNLQQGEYEFPAGATPQQVLQKMAKGEVLIRKFTIPEGKTAYEVTEILKTTEGLQGEIPQISEGSILPSTYHYHYGNSYADVVTQMQGEMQKAFSELWPKRAAELPFSTPEQAIILASIVEKETGNDGERGLVASVFTNRLRIGMKLESDPTAVYGITRGQPLGHIPNRKDIDTNSEYNTYLINGLPPAPICNPGKKALEAVLNPPQSNYLFFVANGSGGHHFAATLKEHNKNISLYRQALAALRN